MLIRFFGVHSSFDFDQIGGTDSYFRRLGVELGRRGHQVEFVHYGALQPGQRQPRDGLSVYDFRSFAEALDHLASADGPVLVNAVRARDRLAFIAFRRRMRRRIDFYIVYSLFAETRWGRARHFLEAAIYPYRAGAVCMSERLVRYVRGFRQRAELLLPPVPPEYFVPLEAKQPRERLVVAYIGRLESGKGAPEAIDILEAICRLPHIEARVSAYAFSDCPEAGPLAARLRANDRIRFRQCTHAGWTPAVEAELAAELRETDVLLLPYRRVSSSIDTPLLLLEGMAGLCCCLTRPVGDLPHVYGPSRLLLDRPNFVEQAVHLLSNGVRDVIEQEKPRIAAQVRRLAIETTCAADRLLEILREGERRWTQ